MAFVQGAAPVRGFALFRQTNELYYLCGVEVPRAYLVIDGRTGHAALFLPKRDERAERAEGREWGPDDEALLRDLTKVDRVLSLEKIERALKSAKLIYTPFSPAEGSTGSRDELSRADRLVAEDPWDGAPTREARLRALLAERAPKAEIKDLSPILDGLRVVKSPREVAVMRRAGLLTALGVMEAMKSTAPGVYEYQLEAAARYVFAVNGAQGIGYRSITAGGPNIANAHYYRNNRALEPGDMVLMDFAPDVGNYTSDIGRMWPVSGKYPPPMRALYGWIVEYHKTVLARIRPDVAADQIMDEAAEAMRPKLAKWKFGKEVYRQAAERTLTWRGHLSHPVGMAVHDVGRYTEGPLVEGMVFSVDPSLWVPEEGLYVRVEDTVAVTKEGIENLTSAAPLDLDEVECLMKERGIVQLVPPIKAVLAPKG